MPVQLSFDSTQPMPGKLVFKLTVPGKLPSWNEILGMQHYSRHSLKKHLSTVFLSSLRATADDCSIKTTSAANTLLIYADTLESFLATRRAQRRSGLLKKNLDQKNRSELPSKSTLFDKPKKLPL